MKSPNILVFYAAHSTHTSTVMEHLCSFKKYSRNNIFYVDAVKESVCSFNLDLYDIIVFHYSVRLTFKDYFSSNFADKIKKFSGKKILFIQDEYENTEVARTWMDNLKFDLVFTCVPNEYVENVYPRTRFPNTKFIQNLTGYVPEDLGAIESLPINKRPIFVGYRGRELHPIYGRLGLEKGEIGRKFKALCGPHAGIDIEWDDRKRIYGSDWYKFVGSCRAMLGTESGANIFDFDGRIKRQINSLVDRDNEVDYEKIAKELSLDSMECKIAKMNQISPKIFEAMSFKTGLILFEGEYSGILEKDIHYIPLKKNFSNFADVIDRLKNDSYMQSIVDRSYEDIIASGKYSYRQFISLFDDEVNMLAGVKSKWVVLDPNSLYLEESSGKTIAYHSKYGFPTLWPIPSKYFNLTQLNFKTEDNILHQLDWLIHILRWYNRTVKKCGVTRILKKIYSLFPSRLKDSLRPFIRLVKDSLKKVASNVG